MMRRGLVATLVCCLAWTAGVAGCQSTSGQPDEQGASAVDDRRDEWLPIVEDEPLPEGDIRRLHNCAEYPFAGGGPGSWESIDGLKRADGALSRHRTSDRVVRIGEPVALDATIEYDSGPLAGEWVRLYVGDCQGWQLIGVRRTDESGYVSFRLDKRLPAGVYGTVFQNVGDLTMVRGQLWVVSPQTEIVVFDVDDAVFDREATKVDDGMPAIVEGAPERSKWHTDRGRLVVYVDRTSEVVPGSVLPRLHLLRMALRDEQFAVGPVVDGARRLGSGTDGDVFPVRGEGEGEWGRANDESRAGPPLPASVTKVYGADEAIMEVLQRWGVDVDDEGLGSP